MDAVVKVKLDEDVKMVFMSSRLEFCEAFQCNWHNREDGNCQLKTIRITEDGKCADYSIKETPEK